MTTDPIQEFLDYMVENQNQNFRERAEGIANWYENHGVLSDRQLNFVFTFAEFRKEAIPVEFIPICGSVEEVARIERSHLAPKRRPKKSDSKAQELVQLIDKIIEILAGYKSEIIDHNQKEKV